MTKSKPVIIQYPRDTDAYLKGSTFECPTPAVAKRVHPDANIIRYADGESYDEASPKKSTSTKKTVRKGTTARTRKTTPPQRPEVESVTTPEGPQNTPEPPTTGDNVEVGS